jgi:DNA recombination protein RmuC
MTRSPFVPASHLRERRRMTESLPTSVLVAILAGWAVLAVVAVLLWRDRHPGLSGSKAMGDFARTQMDNATRLEAMIEILGKGQSQLAQVVNDRLDSVSHRLGDTLEKTKQSTADNLRKLHERLAVIDSAQKNITDLASQVTSLQGVLSNKQERGAFGQGRMEIIVRDGLPKDCYAFQHTLPNKTRPDCVVFLPDRRPLVIDAKFPLEAVTAYREAKNDDERRQSAARVRQDTLRHVGDIAEKYLLPGETQDMALMFVPSESVYAELHDGFDDVVQKAFRARVVIVSPSLLMIAIHVIQQIQKDARTREAASRIQVEVGYLVEDVRRMSERVVKLNQHFGQANEDMRQILISSQKVEQHGARIRDVEFTDEPEFAEIPAPTVPKLESEG